MHSFSARLLCLAVVAATLCCHASAAGVRRPPHPVYRDVRTVSFDYRAHDGLVRRAFVILPRWYGPHFDPPLPLVISPHGRGVGALANVRLWQDFPAIGHFAVVNPQGQGRRLGLYSWGDPGEISDLLRMPELVREAYPWIQINLRRVYAIGGSMGGQEALLMVARRGNGLAGAAAFDAPTNLAERYFFFPRLTNGLWIQSLLRSEVGGTPRLAPHSYAVRSPLHWARAIAFSHVPLELWWSRRDQIVRDGATQSGLLFRRIQTLNPTAPAEEFIGRWRHSTEMGAKLPVALRSFGLWPPFTRHPFRPASRGRIVVTA
jgi:pimeloyl-ACP methyl ester carboxylesterase